MAFEGLSEKLNAVFKRLKGKGKLSEEDIKVAMREVRLALLEADVNYKVVKDFVKSVSERAVGAEVLESLTPAQQVIKIVHEELIRLMGSENARIQFPAHPPCVVMMVGLQGSGKTTHSAKLAKYFKGQGHRPLLVACDIYRPAAIEQLKVVGAQAEVPVFELGQRPPLEIAQKAIAHAKDHGNDLVILDTAGRLHIDEQLMAELKGLKENLEIHETLLVVDAMTGQDAVNVAKSFHEQLDITGVVLTKLDGDTRGGAALSVLAVTGRPIKFAGTGEKLDDLEPFHPDRMASRILGMGDVLTLIEKAQTAVDQKEADKMMRRLKENTFNMEDLLAQMQQIKQMGSLRQIIGMLPGGDKIKEEDIDDKQLVHVEALIRSMTPAERENPKLINPSRKRRIAAGSGQKVEDVNKLLRQFEQMQKIMKQFSGKGKKGKMSRRALLRNMGNMGGMGF
ncbi:MAG TPA: signal recognition particle protein [Candidatus Egerieicola faecale]|uniref:Signal recognition particle protein n=1 Tax=Candidatus Egerieicola faecale TaxID=2840774 RepID=A0A9D1IV68_9FIRM|nr:signal recognition particle protein [Candidatus Egerieicola faecale]